MNTNLKRASVFASLLLFGAAGCADLEVTNPNHPPADVVAGGPLSPTDLEGLIAGTFRQWHQVHNSVDGPWPFLGTAAFEHSATAANFAQVDRSWMPRTAFPDFPSDAQAQAKFLWDGMYRAIATTNSALAGLGTDLIADDAARTARAKAVANLVQGLAYATLAQTFDQAMILPAGFVYDLAKSPAEQLPAPVPYTAIRDHAFARFQEAIDIASANTFTVPAGWMAGERTSAQIVQIAHSYRARFRAETIRRPEDADNAALWQAVLDDIANGITANFNIQMAHPTWNNLSTYYPNAFWGAWGKVPYTLFGMADQSGAYQQWMATMPWLIRQPFLIVTPDERFPQGTTSAQQSQAANMGIYILYNPGGQANEERGVWRHSHYVDDRWWWRSQAGLSGPHPIMTVREMRLLAAEAYYRLGDYAAAAARINVTRQGVGGLQAALPIPNSAAANLDCVPRLPSGACGDLFEMLKWEKRLETYHERYGGFYWDSRRWGDLAEGSFLHMPIPLAELATLGMPIYTHGGQVGDRAPLGVYGY